MIRTRLRHLRPLYRMARDSRLTALVGRPAPLLVAIGFLAAGQVPRLHAQDRPVVNGTVIDVQTEAPVPNAMVAFAGSDQMTMTDSLGHFTLQSPPAWEHRLSVMVLGYLPVEMMVPAEDLERQLVIAIRPDPILLEGLEVLVDRFKRRRRFFAGSVQTLDQTDLYNAGASTAMDAIRRRLVSLSPCAGGSLHDLCVIRRGRRERAVICIDEVPAYGGAADLDAYLPEDLYLVEIYDRGREVRVYTNWFVEKAMIERRSLRPLLFGC